MNVQTAHAHRMRHRTTTGAGRAIERRRPVERPTRPEQVTQITQVTRIDDVPLFLGSHLSSQLFQLHWRWA